jgi:acyl-coenzyme A thioesterase PaaI-like protein
MTAMLRMTASDIERFLAEHFPQAAGFGTIEHVDRESLRLRVPFRDDYLRPGGTLSGPTLMTAADTSVYFLILANLGPVALAVTTSLDIHFLRRPAARDLLAEARLLKLGKRLAVGDVLMRIDGQPEPVAQANVTYSIPER